MSEIAEVMPVEHGSGTGSVASWVEDGTGRVIVGTSDVGSGFVVRTVLEEFAGYAGVVGLPIELDVPA
jgi:hypothetical protein